MPCKWRSSLFQSLIWGLGPSSSSSAQIPEQHRFAGAHILNLAGVKEKQTQSLKRNCKWRLTSNWTLVLCSTPPARSSLRKLLSTLKAEAALHTLALLAHLRSLLCLGKRCIKQVGTRAARWSSRSCRIHTVCSSGVLSPPPQGKNSHSNTCQPNIPSLCKKFVVLGLYNTFGSKQQDSAQRVRNWRKYPLLFTTIFLPKLWYCKKHWCLKKKQHAWWMEKKDISLIAPTQPMSSATLIIPCPEPHQNSSLKTDHTAALITWSHKNCTEGDWL